MCEQFFNAYPDIFIFFYFWFFVAKRTKIGNKVKFILRLFYVRVCACVCLGEALSSSSRQQLHVCVRF